MHFGIARVHHFFVLWEIIWWLNLKKNEVMPMFELAYPKKETACQYMKR